MPLPLIPQQKAAFDVQDLPGLQLWLRADLGVTKATIALSGTFTVTNNSTAVTASTSQTGALIAGMNIIFSSQTTTSYQIASVSGTSIVLTSVFTGTGASGLSATTNDVLISEVFTLTNGSASVTFTTPTSPLYTGMTLYFSTQPNTPYVIFQETSSSALILSTPYTGATTSTANAWYVRVSAWNDQSGKGINYANNTSGLTQPSLSSNIYGKPSINFAGAQTQFLSSSSFASTGTSNTMIIIYRAYVAPPSTGIVLICRISTASTNSWAGIFLGNVGGYTNITFSGSYSSTLTTGVGFNTPLTPGTDMNDHIVVWSWNGGTSTSASSYDGYFDGVSQIISTSTTIYGTATTDLGSLGAFVKSTGAEYANPFTGDIAEIIFLNEVITQAQFTGLMGYLGYRYSPLSGIPGLVMWLRSDLGVTTASASFSGFFNVTNGSTAVTSTVPSAVSLGNAITFSNQTGVSYLVSAVSGTNITLSTAFTGPTNTSGTVTGINVRVTNWYDISNNGLNASNASSGPAYVTAGGQNGLPFLDGYSGGYLSGPSTGISIKQPYEIMMVVKTPPTGGAIQGAIALTPGAGGAITQGTQTSQTIYIYDGSGSQTTCAVATTTNLTCLIDGTYNGASSTLYITGLGTTTASASIGTTGATSQTYSLMCNTAGVQIWAGYIYEVIVFSVILTTAQRTVVKAYLSAKYGFTV